MINKINDMTDLYWHKESKFNIKVRPDIINYFQWAKLIEWLSSLDDTIYYFSSQGMDLFFEDETLITKISFMFPEIKYDVCLNQPEKYHNFMRSLK